jgi:3-hydroxybutyryl-CoA dehydrogenase
VGAGQMGIGIAHVAAHVAKRQVILLDADQKQLDKGLRLIGERFDLSTVQPLLFLLISNADVYLEKDVVKGKITQAEKHETLSRVQTTTDINDLSSANFVIEVKNTHLPLILYSLHNQI